MNDSAYFVLVGHCSHDSGMLSRVIQQACPGVRVASAHNRAEIASLAGPRVLLVNRALDGDFSVETGVDLIRQFATENAAPVMLLISNYEDAQAAAVAVGALPGFGKSQLQQPATKQALVDALQRASRAANAVHEA